MRKEKAFQPKPKGKRNDASIIPERLLTVKEAAQFLGISQRTLHSYSTTHGGEIPVVHLSKRCIRFDVSDLQNFIEQRKRGEL